MFEITHEPLDPAPLVEAVRRDESGAVALFYGVVRNENLGRSVQYLEYDAYPEMAIKKMREVADEVRATLPGHRRRRAAPHRPARDRRDEPARRRLVRPSQGGVRGVPLRRRPHQADRPDLEEGSLGRRRRVDRRPRPRHTAPPVKVAAASSQHRCLTPRYRVFCPLNPAPASHRYLAGPSAGGVQGRSALPQGRRRRRRVPASLSLCSRRYGGRSPLAPRKHARASCNSGVQGRSALPGAHGGVLRVLLHIHNREGGAAQLTQRGNAMSTRTRCALSGAHARQAGCRGAAPCRGAHGGCPPVFFFKFTIGGRSSPTGCAALPLRRKEKPAGCDRRACHRNETRTR